MILLIGVCFVIGYLMIALEHPLKLDKSVPALLIGSLCWALVSLGGIEVLDHQITNYETNTNKKDHNLSFI